MKLSSVVLSFALAQSSLAFSLDRADKIEHRQYEKAYVTHQISVENVSGISLVISKTLEVDGYNNYEIEGEFLHIDHPKSWWAYEPYYGDIDVSHTETAMFPKPPPSIETLERTFFFPANAKNTVGLSLLIPAGFEIKDIIKHAISGE